LGETKKLIPLKRGRGVASKKRSSGKKGETHWDRESLVPHEISPKKKRRKGEREYLLWTRDRVQQRRKKPTCLEKKGQGRRNLES